MIFRIGHSLQCQTVYHAEIPYQPKNYFSTIKKHQIYSFPRFGSFRRTLLYIYQRSLTYLKNARNGVGNALRHLIFIGNHERNGRDLNGGQCPNFRISPRHRGRGVRGIARRSKHDLPWIGQRRTVCDSTSATS